MTRKERRSRMGFTLVELLVVIVVLFILAAIFLPAVRFSGAGREAARRAICNNQSRQIALAIASFETVHGRYPGYVEQPNPDSDREIPWIVSLMPYIGGQAVYDSWMNSSTPPDRIYVKMLRCPSDSPVEF